MTMTVSDASCGTDSEEVMIEVIGQDGLVHHLGPFRDRRAAEAWLTQNASPQSCDDHKFTSVNDAPVRDRRA